MNTIDINCDLGESFGQYSIGNDPEILKYISSANIACGFHAGDPLVIQKTIVSALEYGVAIGAHPGFPDLQGFGRRNMKLSEDELFSCILYQVGALKAMTEALGGQLHHVKPHGAMYNMAACDYNMALCIAKAVQKIDPSLLFVGLAHSSLIDAAKSLGLKTANEAFADRRYMRDGTLVSRSNPRAVIHNERESIHQVLQLISDKQVVSFDHKTIDMHADTICIHGDNTEALQFAKALKENIEKKGYCIKALKK